MAPPVWAGTKLYFLAIEVEGKLFLVDLDEPGWHVTHADLMRVVGVWHLVRKSDSVVPFSMRVEPGEQPYCVIKHVGQVTPHLEIEAYGIGKKRLDGHVDRMWIMPDGQVCGGDDVEWFGVQLLRAMAARAAIVEAQGGSATSQEEVQVQDDPTVKDDHETGSTSVDSEGTHEASLTSTKAETTTQRVDEQSVDPDSDAATDKAD